MCLFLITLFAHALFEPKAQRKINTTEPQKSGLWHNAAVSIRWADSAFCLPLSERSMILKQALVTTLYGIKLIIDRARLLSSPFVGKLQIINWLYLSFSILWNFDRSKISSPKPILTNPITKLHCRNIWDCINYCDTVLNPDLSYLSHNGSIEAKSVCDHHVDLPLAVLLSDTLVGGESRQGGLQCGQAVARGLADVKQLTCLLKNRKQKLLSAERGYQSQ